MIETSPAFQKIARPEQLKERLANFLTFACLLLAALPPVFLAGQIIQYGLQLPYNDQVLFMPVILKVHTGGFTFNDFWSQNNEHRLVVWRIIDLALAKVGGFSVAKELWVSFICALLTLVVVSRLAWRSLPRLWAGVMVVVFSGLIFSPIQWENWQWGFQPPWFMVNFLAVLAIVCLSSRPVRWWNFGLAIGLTFLASFTIGSSLPLWPVVAVGILIDWSHWRWKYLIGWLAAAGVTGGLYLYQYNIALGINDQTQNKTFFLTHLPQTALFILNYLGSPVAHWTDTAQGAPWFSLVALILIIFGLGWVWRQSRQTLEAKQTWAKLWPWLIITLFGLGNATITAISRASLGVDVALLSRYTTVAIWFWIGGLMIIVVVGRDMVLKLSGSRLRLIWAGIAIVGLTLAVSVGFTYQQGTATWQATARYVNAAYPFFYDYQDAPDDVIGRPFFDSAPVGRQLAWSLSRFGEGPFRITKEQYQQAQATHWQQQIKDNDYRANVYPANLMVMTYGDGASVRVKGDHIVFQHSGPLPTSIEYDLTKFYQANKLSASKKPVLVEIQMETAEFAKVFFDYGQGFSYGQQLALTTAQESNNQRIFRLELPEGTTRFRIDGLYRVSRVQSDSLKVIVYTKD